MIRLERSELSVPATNRRMVEKAVGLPADVVMLDVEDSVPAERKATGRAAVIAALRELDWGVKPVAYRVNGVRTPYFYRDLIEVVEAAGDRLALIVLPKVESPAELAAAELLLRGVEQATGLEVGRIGLEAQLESARGMVQAEAIATGAERLESLIFGPGDFAASIGMPVESLGVRDQWDELAGGDRYHYPMARLLLAARAAGKRAVDGPSADYRDLEAFRRSCLRARALGYDGKWCIHPAQLPIANQVFSPAESEVRRAQEVLAAYQAATAEGRGAVGMGADMIDLASVRLAERTLELAAQVKE